MICVFKRMVIQSVKGVFPCLICSGCLKRRCRRSSLSFRWRMVRPRVDDRKVISGIIFVLKMVCLGAMHPCKYGPHKTLYSRFRRWIEMGVFDKIFSYLTADNGPPDILMIDARHYITLFWKEDDNITRPHSSLGHLTPREYAQNQSLQLRAA